MARSRRRNGRWECSEHDALSQQQEPKPALSIFTVSCMQWGAHFPCEGKSLGRTQTLQTCAFNSATKGGNRTFAARATSQSRFPKSGHSAQKQTNNQSRIVSARNWVAGRWNVILADHFTNQHLWFNVCKIWDISKHGASDF
jgi:hypothetical protein